MPVIIYNACFTVSDNLDERMILCLAAKGPISKYSIAKELGAPPGKRILEFYPYIHGHSISLMKCGYLTIAGKTMAGKRKSIIYDLSFRGRLYALTIVKSSTAAVEQLRKFVKSAGIRDINNKVITDLNPFHMLNRWIAAGVSQDYIYDKIAPRLIEAISAGSINVNAKGEEQIFKQFCSIICEILREDNREAELANAGNVKFINYCRIMLRAIEDSYVSNENPYVSIIPPWLDELNYHLSNIVSSNHHH